MSLRGIFAGMLLLTGLEAVVSSQQASQRFGGLLSSVGRGVRYFLDPTVPAIPDRRTGGGSGSGGLGGLLGVLPINPLNPLDPFKKGPLTGLPFSPISTIPTHAPAPVVVST